MPFDEAAARPSTRTGLPTSCQTCRLRKIRCQPAEDGGSDQCAACRKKGIVCVFVERSRTRNRSGKIVEAARNRYGNVVPASSNSSSSSSSVSPPSTATEDLLVQNNLASSFGARLFDLWLDRRQTRSSMPNVDLPVVDFWELLDKYNDVGQRLDRLSPVDQLLCRITYAFAAPLHLPDRLAGNSRRDIANRLLQEAEALADSLHIWRKVELGHVASLILLSRAKGTGHYTDSESMPYLSAAVAQFRQLTRRSIPNLEEGDEPMRRLGWSMIVADVLGAAERRERPILFRDEVEQLLSGVVPVLPTSEQLLAAADISGDLSLAWILQAVQVVVLIAHDLATYTSADNFSLDTTTKLWLCLDEVYGWARGTLFAVCPTDRVGHGLIRVYAHVLWVGTLALEMSLIEHLSHLITRAATPTARSRVLQDTEVLSDLVTIVARVLDLATAFANAPSSDPTLFPLGAVDKLMSLQHLSEQVRYLSRGYPSAQMTATLTTLDEEGLALGGANASTMLDIAVSDPHSSSTTLDLHSSSGSAAPSYSTPGSASSSPWLCDFHLIPPLHGTPAAISPAEEWRWELV
ncbi:hypothetical protein JCM3774_004472 [Rhodotorula dairenensis]